MAKHKHKNASACEYCRRMRLAGARLRLIRRERGYTREQVGRLVGVSGRMVSFWERGAVLPTLTFAFYLAHVFNRQVVDLFFPLHDYARQDVRHELDQIEVL